MKGRKVAEKALIIGTGPTGRGIAEGLAARGVECTCIAPQGRDDGWPEPLGADPEPRIEILPVDACVSCRGAVGNFRLGFKVPGGIEEKCVSHIVLADEALRESNIAAYGLHPDPGIFTLSRAWEMHRGPAKARRILDAAKRIALITGLAFESDPVVAGEAMRLALELQKTGTCQTYLLTGNLKVGDRDLEALYREAKRAGTVFLKFADTRPHMIQDESGRLTIEGTDEITRQPFRLVPDAAIIDETLRPAPLIRRIAEMLDLEMGPDGFPQAENVHRAPVCTNRRGVWVAGPSRGTKSAAAWPADVDCVVAAVRAEATSCRPEPISGKARIVPGQCVRCLTCYRSCTYRAIELNTRVVVHADACEGCGICAAECPRTAIRLIMPDGDPWIPGAGVQPVQIQTPPPAEGFVPSITAFCCRRSAVPAAASAAATGCRLPSGLHIVAVPCAGSLSTDHILDAFRSGADGVIVLSCHPDNCHAGHGNLLAGRRVDGLLELLPQVGFDAGRLKLKTLASTMGKGLADTLSAFETELLPLGPNPLKKDKRS